MFLLRAKESLQVPNISNYFIVFVKIVANKYVAKKLDHIMIEISGNAIIITLCETLW